ncbi:endolytic transglycosylase MltG [Patescibacteria group bacterium]|nr:endolytic transglycosylase MltG [Patescibacteria group bacterium]
MKKGSAFFFYLLFVGVALFLFFRFSAPGSQSPVESFGPTEEVTNISREEKEHLVISKGEGLKEIAEKLKEKGVIVNELFFKVYAFLTNTKNRLLPGQYEIPKDISLKDLLAILSSSPLAPEETVTVIEGWDNKRIASFLEQEGLTTKDDFFLALDYLSQDQEFLTQYKDFFPLNPRRQNKAEIFQGYLFPDTYRFYQESTAEAIIRKMIANFAQKFDAGLLAQVKESGRTVPEILTMASLLEKEAFLDQDRRLIADVFWTRLEINWALESCATINYILGDPKERLSFDDTRIPSEYNTYLHPGLPPGPINNPGLSSLQAAVDPLENNYCCFLSTPEGQIIFSQTVEEHNRNKQVYLK